MSNAILSEKKTFVLKEAAKWAKIFAIITIASLVVSLLQVIVTSAGNVTLLITSVLTTLIASSVSIAFIIFLFYFSNHIKTGADTNDMHLIERGLNNLKWYFAINGIILIIALGFLLLALFVGLIFAAVAA